MFNIFKSYEKEEEYRLQRYQKLKKETFDKLGIDPSYHNMFLQILDKLWIGDDKVVDIENLEWSSHLTHTDCGPEFDNIIKIKTHFLPQNCSIKNRSNRYFLENLRKESISHNSKCEFESIYLVSDLMIGVNFKIIITNK